MWLAPTRVTLRHAFRRAVTSPRAGVSCVPVHVQDFTFSPADWRPAEDEILIRNAFASLSTPAPTQPEPEPVTPFYGLQDAHGRVVTRGSRETDDNNNKDGTTQSDCVRYVPGVAGSGSVLSVGRGLDASVWLSQRVAYLTLLARSDLSQRWSACATDEAKERFACVRGAFSSFLLVKCASTVRVPAGVTDQQAAVVMTHGLLAHYLVTDSYPIGPGSIVVVHAAAGGTGLLVCQMAKLRGAEMVIGVCGGAEKAELAKRVGKADYVIDYKAEPDWAGAVRKLLPQGRQGVNAVYADEALVSSSGPQQLAPSVSALQSLLPSSELAGAARLFSYTVRPELSLASAVGSPGSRRVSLGDVVAAMRREDAHARLSALLDQVQKAELTAAVGTVWPLRKIENAYHDLTTGAVAGGAALLNCVD